MERYRIQIFKINMIIWLILTVLWVCERESYQSEILTDQYTAFQKFEFEFGGIQKMEFLSNGKSCGGVEPPQERVLVPHNLWVSFGWHYTAHSQIHPSPLSSGPLHRGRAGLLIASRLHPAMGGTLTQGPPSLLMDTIAWD